MQNYMFKIEKGKVWYYNIGLVGDVQSCIMSLGELYQAGWHIDKDGDELSLLPPDDSMKVPVFYKNKSLAIGSHVRCVQEVLQEEEADMVRAVIQLSDNFNDHNKLVRYSLDMVK